MDVACVAARWHGIVYLCSLVFLVSVLLSISFPCRSNVQSSSLLHSPSLKACEFDSFLQYLPRYSAARRETPSWVSYRFSHRYDGSMGFNVGKGAISELDFLH